MPKLSELIPVMAGALGVPETTVGVIARHARAAGRISSKGRGPGGAEMSATDCINLLIGVLVTHVGTQAKDVGDAIDLVRSLVLRPASLANYEHWRDKGEIRGPLRSLITDLAWIGNFSEALEYLLTKQDRKAWNEFMSSIPLEEGYRHFKTAINQGRSISTNISFRISERFAIQFIYQPAEASNKPTPSLSEAGIGDLQTRVSFGPNALTALMDFVDQSNTRVEKHADKRQSVPGHSARRRQDR